MIGFIIGVICGGAGAFAIAGMNHRHGWERCSCHHRRGHLALSALKIERGRIFMQLNPVTAYDSERRPITSNPKNPDGTLNETVKIDWTSSNPEQVPIEYVDELGRQIWMNTPLDSGSATVTGKAPGYNPTTVDFSYSPGVPRELNSEVGGPVPDIA
jgi:hypothetical protein